MAVDWRITAGMAEDMADLILAAIDGGAGAGKLRIYDGSQPAGPGTAISDQTLLAEITLNDPSFTSSNGVLTLDVDPTIEDSSANATGTASWGRFVDSDNNAVIDGNVGTSGASINLNTTSIVEAGPVRITSGTITVPTGSS